MSARHIRQRNDLANICLGLLAEGPTTTNEIAVETGLSGDAIGDCLGRLHRNGLAARRPFIDYCGPIRNVSLWSLPSYEASNAQAG